MPEQNSNHSTAPTMGSLTAEQQRKALGILAADRVTGMAGAMRSRLMAERLARKSQDGTLGKETTMHEDELLSDMNINVGDTYHVQSPPPQPPAQEQPTITRRQQSGTPHRSVLPYVLAAALAGGALGVGAAALPAWLSHDKEPAVAPSAADTDTQYELRITSGE